MRTLPGAREGAHHVRSATIHKGDGHKGDVQKGDGHKGDGHKGDGHKGDGHKGGRLPLRSWGRPAGRRGVAQLGSAPALGAGGRGFKSRLPDPALRRPARGPGWKPVAAR